MSFLHPGLLWGLVALSLPILVHLFNQRRPRPLAFGAIEFVLRSQRQRARKLRLRHVLLLALRCALLAAIALAIAGPLLRPRGPAHTVAQGPRATALVLDASLSMRARIGNETLFARAKSEALSALDRLSPDEPATAVICGRAGEEPAAEPPVPGFDRAAVRRALAAAEPSFAHSSLSSCLGVAATALGQSQVAGKRILGFTDLAAHAIQLDAPAATVPQPKGQPPLRPEVTLIDAGAGREVRNVGLLGVALRPQASLGARGTAVVATVWNGGDQPVAALPISLRAGGQELAKGFVDVPAHATAQKTLSAVLPAGPVAGRVQLPRADDEGLDEDDALDFTADLPREVQALIVDGAPSALRSHDEAFFVEAALSAARSAGRIAARTLDADAAAARPLDGVDVVLLLNVPPPSPAFAEKLRAFVERGGGLFIALGDHTDPDAMNAALGPLLPRKLHALKSTSAGGEAAEPGAPVAEGKSSAAADALFGAVVWEHPIFRIFGPAEREGLMGARTSRYALLEPDASQATRALLSFDDGAPALVESHLGRGRVLLFTSSAAQEWTDWPIRSSFLPVVQQLTVYLAAALEQPPQPPSRVGEVRELRLPPETPLAEVLGPDGAKVPIAPGARVGPLPRPGLYRVRLAHPGGPVEEPAASFAAVLDPRESNLRKIDERDLRAWLGADPGGQVSATSALEAQGDRGRPLWGLLFLAAALAALGEGMLARR